MTARAMSLSRVSAFDRRKAAIHEAGHVVVADHVNRDRQVRGASAHIFRNATDDHRNQKTWLGKAEFSDSYLSPFDRRMIACAGEAAELIWEKSEPEPFDWWCPEAMSPSDWKLAECEPGEPDELCCEAIEELARLLSRDGPLWRDVTHEARRLIVDERMTVSQHFPDRSSSAPYLRKCVVYGRSPLHH